MTNLTFILLILLSLLSFSVIILFYRLSTLKKEVEEIKVFNQKLFTRLSSLMKDMQSMSTATVGLSHKLNKMSDQVVHLDDRQDEIDLRDQTEKPIQQAIALVDRGADIDEIMDTCELSKAEAELLIHLHRE